MALNATFREAVWLFPPAFVLHVVEEWPRFKRWANIHASSRFTQRDYVTIHIAGVALAILFAAAVSRYSNPVFVFAFFAFVFAPAVFFNTIFHAGATLITFEYCPGVVTAVTLYLPVFFIVSQTAWKQRLLSGQTLAAALVLAGAFHFWEVGHNVYKAW